MYKLVLINTNVTCPLINLDIYYKRQHYRLSHIKPPTISDKITITFTQREIAAHPWRAGELLGPSWCCAFFLAFVFFVQMLCGSCMEGLWHFLFGMNVVFVTNSIGKWIKVCIFCLIEILFVDDQCFNITFTCCLLQFWNVIVTML